MGARRQPQFRVLLAIFTIWSIHMSSAWEANYDEARIPDYQLPDALLCTDGTRVADKATWEGKRRPELLELFRTHVYGRMPERPDSMHWKVLEADDHALDGKARRRQVRIYLTADDAEPCFDLLLYLPAEAKGPVPVFLGLNFKGNHSIHADPAILLKPPCLPPGKPMPDNLEGTRGTQSRRWPVERILARGYALATVYYGDIAPDYDDKFANPVHQLFLKMGVPRESLGAISAWSWGLSRTLDYLLESGEIDGGEVAVMGHSRLGKTALWAGASDPRFHMVVSNDSGCGGAALSRRAIGETVWRINTSFPHWFCAKFHDYNNQENSLPVDQHELIALSAPRATYVASAAEDLWADPKGEFLSTYHAAPVFALYGTKGPDTPDFPAIHQPQGETLRYHVRAGGHDVTNYDWDQYMDLADHAFRGPVAQ
jgi:hypothetical protein